MSDTHRRILDGAERIYAGAQSSYDEREWWWAELNAGVAMGAAALIAADPETPDEMRVIGEELLSHAKTLAERARVALVKAQSEGRMSGVSVEKALSSTDDVVAFLLSAYRGNHERANS